VSWVAARRIVATVAAKSVAEFLARRALECVSVRLDRMKLTVHSEEEPAVPVAPRSSPRPARKSAS
jgi:hypothetical protein